MDTHMTHLEPELHASRSARLPGEPDLDGPASDRHQDTDSLRASDGGEEPTSLDGMANVANASDQAPAAAAHRGRKGSLLTGASLGVLILVAGGVFLLSPVNTVIPVPAPIRGAANQAQQAVAGLFGPVAPIPPAARQVAEPGSQSAAVAPSARQAQTPIRDPVVAPAAKLAATALPARPESVTAKPYPEQSRDRTLQELVGLGPSQPVSKPATTPEPQAKPTQMPVSNPASTPPVGVAEPGSIQTPARTPARTDLPAQPATAPVPNDITGSVTQAALGQTAPSLRPAERDVAPEPAPAVEPLEAARPATLAAVTPPAVPPTASAAPKQDPVESRPPVLVLSVPAGHQEQAEVLQYVTGLTSEITRLRAENEVLRKDVVRRMTQQEAQLADYNRRLSVAEARAALRSAAEVGKSDDTPPSGPAPKPLTLTISAPVPPGPAADTRSLSGPAVKLRYRVQAASPGLALLAEVGRGGGEGAQLQVAVGDQIPGYGVVKSVAQRGPSWVVQTEHGSID